MLNFAVIGYGNRISGIVDKLSESGEARLCAVMDTDLEAAKQKDREKGYENVNYFYSVFKKACGTTPSQYRK